MFSLAMGVGVGHFSISLFFFVELEVGVLGI